MQKWISYWLNWLFSELSSDVSMLQMKEQQRIATLNSLNATLLRKEHHIVCQLKSNVSNFLLKWPKATHPEFCKSHIYIYIYLSQGIHKLMLNNIYLVYLKWLRDVSKLDESHPVKILSDREQGRGGGCRCRMFYF